jgi:hypothetical protein
VADLDAARRWYQYALGLTGIIERSSCLSPPSARSSCKVQAARLGGRWRRQAIAGAAAIAVAVAAGILTLITTSNRCSYTMAAGFIAALLAYGSLLLLATTSEQDNPASSRLRRDTPGRDA